MPEMKEIILYIGAPKCGSTFLFSTLRSEQYKHKLAQIGFSFIDTFKTLLEL